MRLRGSGGVILGVKQIQVYVNAGPETLARPDYDGNGWTELPQELASKQAIINIHNNDNRCIEYCLIAKVLLDDGRLPPDPQCVSHYQCGKRLGNGKRSGVMVPIDVGLDMSMFAEGAIDAQLLSFEEANDFEVYIYKWEQFKCRGEVSKARAYVTRTPQGRHAREVVLMLWKKHFSLVKN